MKLLHAHRRLAARFLPTDRGQTLVEYSLLIGLIAVVSIAALFALGQAVGGPFTEVSDAIADALSGGGGDGGGDSM